MFSEVFKGKKVLITGDTGFKGSWLSLWLVKLGAEVYGYALPPRGENDNFVVCEMEKRTQHIDGDVRNIETVVDYFNKIQPDIAFHLAAQPLVLESYKNPYETYSTNVMGVVNFFEAVRNTPKVKVAINITSDKCYKNYEWLWGYRENDRLGGEDPYSASKSASEIITTSYIKSFFSDENTANVASVRAGNVIGAGDWAENRIIPDLFRAKISNRPLIIRNPSSTRPWQHVLEPLSGYLNLAEKLYKNGDRFQGGWNFGPCDNINYTVSELVSEIANNDEGIKFTLKRVNGNQEARLLKLDISKARNELNWFPVLSFKETVKWTINGYQSDIKGDLPHKERSTTIDSYINRAKECAIPWALN